MEEGQKHIDDFFREELGNYTEMPPEKVWEDLSQRLDDTRRPRFGGWWPWIVVLLLIGSVAGYMVLSKKNNPGNPDNTIAVVDKGLSVSSNGLPEQPAESTSRKTDIHPAQTQPPITVDTTQRTHFRAAQLPTRQQQPKAHHNQPKTMGTPVTGNTTTDTKGVPTTEQPNTAANKTASSITTGHPKTKKAKQKAEEPTAAPIPVAASNSADVNKHQPADENKTATAAPLANNSTKPTGSSVQSSTKKTASTTKHNKPALKTTAVAASSPGAINNAVTPKAENKKQKAPVTTIADSDKTTVTRPAAVAVPATSSITSAKTKTQKATTKKTNQTAASKPATTSNTASQKQSAPNTTTSADSDKTAVTKPAATAVPATSGITSTKTKTQKATTKKTNQTAASKPATTSHTSSQKQSTPNTTTANTSPDKPAAVPPAKAKTTAAAATPGNAAKNKTNTARIVAGNQPKPNNKTATAPAATHDAKQSIAVVPAAEAAKKPLPEPKPANAVAQTTTFQPTPNPANNLLMKPVEESKKTLDEDKEDEDNDKAPMHDEGEENEAKPQQPQPAAEHDPRAGIPVSAYIDKAVTPQPKAAGDENDAADKKKIDLQNPAGGAGGNMSPSIGKDRKPPSTLEGGAKFGFEKGFSSVTSNKWVATIYLQYNLSPKAAFLVQPSVKFAQMNKSINSSQSFYNVTGTTVNSTQRMDSITTPPFFDTVYNYYYKQTYDSIHVTQSSTKNYVEFEIPLIFKYTIAENLSLLAGVTMNFGSIPTVSSSSNTYNGLTLQDSVVNVHGNPNYQISVNDSFHHTAAPIEGYNPNSNQNPATNPIRFGYLLGMNYLLKDRVLFDLTIQQSFSKMNNVPNADIRSVLTQPYVRFSVGYKIFGGKKKTVQQ